MLRVSRAWLLLVTAVTLLALVMAACGGGGEETASTGTPAAGTPKATATAAATNTPKATATATVTNTPKATATATASATAQTTATAATSTPTATPRPGGDSSEGVTDTEILLGSHFVQTGTWGAAFAPVLKGIQAYFNYVNAEKGGVCGRKIVLDAEDDQYLPDRAVEVTRKLVEQEHIFAMVAGLGTAAHSAVWNYLNERGIPDLWVMAGEHMFNADPQGHPWTVPILPDYVAEGKTFGKYISEHFPGEKVGILYQNDDFGKNVLEGLQAGLDPTKNELVSPQAYEATDISIRSQVTNAKQAGATVMVCGCIPPPAAQAIKSATAMGWRPQWFIDYVDSDQSMFQFATPEEMEGTLSLQGNKLAQWTDDPTIAKHIEIMNKYGNYPPGNYTIEGELAASLTEEVLNRACDNPTKSLTRQGLMDAVESLRDFVSPDPTMQLGIPGITITISADDHVPIKAMRFIRAKVVDGKGVWEYEGDLVPFQ